MEGDDTTLPLSAEETDPFLGPLSADTLLPAAAVPYKVLPVATAPPPDGGDLPRIHSPDAFFTSAPPAATAPASSAAAAASSHPPPAEEENDNPPLFATAGSPRRFALPPLVLLSAQSPLTRRVPPPAAPSERRSRNPCSNELVAAALSTPGGDDEGEAPGSRVPPAPNRSPVMAGTREVAVEPRTVRTVLSSPAVAKGFDDGRSADFPEVFP